MKQFLKKNYSCILGILLSLLVFSNIVSAELDINRTERTINPLDYSQPVNRDHFTVRELPFFDDMEDGENEWNAHGLFRLIENPDTAQVMNPWVNPLLVHYPDEEGYLPSAYSGSNAWSYRDQWTNSFIGFPFPPQIPLSGGTSFIPTVGTLTSPTIDLTDVDDATLTFWTWWEIEGVDVNRYDIMTVLISENGEDYSILGMLNPFNDVDGLPFIPYSTGGLGAPGVWVKECFDISDYTGSEVNIQFLFTTVDNLYNGFRGWFIDDLMVDGGTFSAPVINSLNPEAGIAGTVINIYGENFVNGAQVKIGGWTTLSKVLSCNHVQAYAPSIFPGAKDVRVTNPDDQYDQLDNGFNATYTLPPIIAAIYPLEGENDTSTDVTITGEMFEDGATCYIGDTEMDNVVYQSSAQITATIPAGLSAGFKTIKVINPDTQYDQLTDGFHVANPGEAIYSSVVINEIMQNPSVVDDEMGEWFELYNATVDDIDINNWIIEDNDGESHVIDNGGSLIIPSNGYIVLGNNDNMSSNGGTPVDYEYSDFTLGNDDDEILLYSSEDDLVDIVEYDGGIDFPDPSGRSMELRMIQTNNNMGFNWVAAIMEYGDGDYGTPGEENAGSSLLGLIYTDPGEVDFGAVEIDDHDTLNLFIGNLGQTPYIIQSIEVDESAFSLDLPGSELPDTIGAGGGIVVEVSFSPTEITVYEGTITITSTAYNDPFMEVPVMGEGVETTVFDTNIHSIPDQFILHNNYPNPFNPVTSIQFGLPRKEMVLINIYDISGKLIKQLINNEKEAGYHAIRWDGTDELGHPVSSGIYFYRFEAGNYDQIKKCILIK